MSRPDASADPVPVPVRWWSQGWRILLAFAVGALMLAAAAPAQARWSMWCDLGIGLGCLVLLGWRRRWPRAVALIIGLAGALSAFSFGPWLLAAVSLSTRRRPVDLALLAGTAFVSSMGFDALRPQSDPAPWWIMLLVTVLVVAVCAATGWYLGARRDLLLTLQARAVTAEREQAARVAEARATERTAIAREMHDVLAHRISLITLHAGALTYRRDLSPEQTAEAAAVIEANAHLALSDLRDVLGVLRSREPAEARRPQPGWADLPALFAEARTAGTGLRIVDELTHEPPATLGRHGYRIVQEALTNARKHAPGCVTTVGLRGRPGAELELTVSNPRPRGGVRPAQGAGLGLVGLTERAQLAGGVLEVESGGSADFRVRARLPWPAQEGEPESAPTPPGEAVGREGGVAHRAEQQQRRDEMEHRG